MTWRGKSPSYDEQTKSLMFLLLIEMSYNYMLIQFYIDYVWHDRSLGMFRFTYITDDMPLLQARRFKGTVRDF